MKEKIEVGEFVRTATGKIDKVISNEYFLQMYVECEKGIYAEGGIVKHSHNLIDLIEPGDFVNGYPVIKYTDGDLVLEDCIYSILRMTPIDNIVTKEQFASMQYNVEVEECH